MRPSWVSVVAGTYLAAFALGLTATADVPSHLFFLSRQRAPVDQPNNFAAGLSVGTLGLGADFSAKISPWLVLRMTGGGYELSVTHDLQDNSSRRK